MIRPTVPDDTPALLDLTRATGVFKSHEIDTLDEVLSDYFAAESENGHVAVTLEDGDAILGFAYYAPAPMTDRAWHLYWIAVRKAQHARGLGSQLLRHTEADVRGRGGRVLFIETSGLPNYEPTRRFYLKHGYDLEATLRDFYADGDDMIVFRKHLIGT